VPLRVGGTFFQNPTRGVTMIRWNRILLSTAVLAVPTVILLHHFNQPQDQPTAPVTKVNVKRLEPSSTTGERERIEAQLSALKQQMSQLDETVRAARAPAPTEAHAASSEPASRADKIAAEEAETQQTAQFLDGTLASEAADPRWSAATAQQISRSFPSTAQDHTRVSEVRCASTLCRIEATHDNFEAEQAFILQLGQLESFRQSEGFGQRVERTDGTIATTMFVSRSGRRLPSAAAGADPQS
jgi:hypothetical protein